MMFVCNTFSFTALCLATIYYCAISAHCQYVLWRLVDPYKATQNARLLREVGQDLEFALDLTRNSVSSPSSGSSSSSGGGAELILVPEQMTTGDLSASRDSDQLGASSLRREQTINFPISQEAVDGPYAALDAAALTSSAHSSNNNNRHQIACSSLKGGCQRKLANELDSIELVPVSKDEQANRLKISKNVERILSQFMRKPKYTQN